jgi:hypothetical protein
MAFEGTVADYHMKLTAMKKEEVIGSSERQGWEIR